MVKDNWEIVFKEGWELHWRFAFLDDDNIITAIDCLNPDYNKCVGDLIYKIKYSKGTREAEVFHNEITILN